MTTAHPTAQPPGQQPTGLIAALDIGGTKIAGALVDQHGTLLHRVQRPTFAHDPGEAVMLTVHRVIEELAEDPRWSEVRAVGIGCAGPVDITRGTVSPVNIAGWRDFPLVAQVAADPAVLGLAKEAGLPPEQGVPVRLAGDGVAMAAGEHWCGAARDSANAICLVVSTGVGAGLVLDGAVRPGPSGNAGHLGHLTVDFNGEPCTCGSRGCVEMLASGTAIARHALRSGWRPAARDAATDAAAVAESARQGDPPALAAYERAGQALAAGIAATATLLDLRLAVIGGGVAGAGDLLLAPLRRHLDVYGALSFVRPIEVRLTELGPNAGLIGAAALTTTAAR
ncbi:ROK family protein [Kitasatospora kifunensis]|uniref:Glucokinase n=1 Tax=Kitasatospora kifunensis TaxID=58351 RepID=A0A7W7QXY8_KITKI|nr:ROK family protein [Kitasatospora kifunensis]MBB4921589.1 glucokinase [Kitasatospora kifunensis]